MKSYSDGFFKICYLDLLTKVVLGFYCSVLLCFGFYFKMKDNEEFFIGNARFKYETMLHKYI